MRAFQSSLMSYSKCYPGIVEQKDAREITGYSELLLISTDPPYYDNIGYANLSDFFYVWLRRSVGQIYPNLFSTLLVPKVNELVASPYRFDGDKDKAQKFFQDEVALRSLQKE